jgi:tetrahydromethanopterin S-methyltransferase subunit B
MSDEFDGIAPFDSAVPEADPVPTGDDTVSPRRGREGRGKRLVWEFVLGVAVMGLVTLLLVVFFG